MSISRDAIQILFDSGFRCTNRYEHPDALDIDPWTCPHCRALAHTTAQRILALTPSHATAAQ